MNAWEPTLRREFEAAEGSFLIQLRCNMKWDRDAFARLVAAMEACAADHEGRESLERWVAHGFWYLEGFVPEWSGHPDFPRPEPTYHRRACQRLHELAYWFFTGEHSLANGGPFEPLSSG